MKIILDKKDNLILDKHNWYIRKDGYVYSVANNKTIYLHRIITKCPSNLSVDHINGNPLDNRRKNLRICSHQQNLMNKRSHPNKTSKYKGVSWSKNSKKWVAFINKNYKTYFLGYFFIEKDASKAYVRAAKKMFGKFFNNRTR